jgi:O-antigen/teichoic acid export membrane protein
MDMSQIKNGALLSYLNIFITTIVGLIITPFIINQLGDSEYGLYSLIGSLVSYFTLVDFGLGATVVRFVAKFRVKNQAEKQSEFLGTILGLYLFITIAILALGVLLYFNLEVLFGEALSSSEINKGKLMFILLLFNLGISLPGNIFLGVANAYEKFIYTRGILIIKYLVRALTIFIILNFYKSAIILVVVDTIINVLYLLINFLYSKNYLNITFKFSKFNLGSIKNIFGFSIWMFILSLVSQFQWQGGQIVVGMRGGAEMVAIYSVGILLGTYYGAFSSAISSLFLPKATKMVVNLDSTEDLSNFFVKVGRLSCVVLFAVLGGFYLFGKDFIYLWLDEGYLASYWIALLIMIFYTIPLTQTFATSVLEASNKIHYKSITYVILIPLGTIFGYILYPIFGLYGVISCIGVFWIIGVGILNYFYSKILGLNIGEFFWNCLKACLPLILLLIIFEFLNFYISHNNSWLLFFLKGLVFLVSYLSFYYLLFFNEFEKKILKNLLK